ncbi:hypothetical protein WN943_020994 [Citrus x changshan-huyou]|uniref:CW-type domain-containing protein n=3 Tax=Citrus sinensis TaxID=2711 RepID=A0A067FW63_CITSI|nr:hypothetical protein CISIN_1g004283mg [Citrus sinensis]KDO71580.1 hypothetical protein CISIN_1g004283mg [Citrus sinensis]KDO71581.1 hypothetical protein CISIN_1g004283mg [Citrus sinensis]KDO71582.1 hypothetical protein CISIN_1g004283mg [Citrus sinensis]KDO71583.1 hypothetical protein CISIN_1g004283mg [Citrus sinensis]
MLSDADVDNKIPTQGLRYADASDSEYYILLTKDKKPICRTRCLNPPEHLPHHWNVNDIVPTSKIILDGMSHCFLSPAPECSRDHNEWRRFLIYLQGRDMVAIAKFKFWEFYILPPDQTSNFTNIRVAYKMEKTRNASNGRGHGESGRSCQVVRPTATKANINDSPTLPVNIVKETVSRGNACIQARVSDTSEDNFSPVLKFSPVVGDRLSSESTIETCSRPEPRAVKQAGPLEKNFVRADPSYLQTLGQAHSGWIFGAIAELVDNSRDAKATKLEISIESIYFKKAGKDIPMLSIIDDGHGMTHQDVVRMTYFGHKQPDADDPNRIGRFGVGFKTGAMRLGKDALVLTQTADSRSIAFLSQSLNQGKDNLEIPIVSYYRKGQFMELDTVVQSEATAKYNLKSIKEFSPFNKYLIGEKAGLFQDKCTGTQIYIWNLDQWGSNYCLEWDNGLNGGSSFHQGDILIRSRRIRSRPGQISQKVPLDYSLRSYLEVIFLVPRMKIYVQGSLVRSRPLAKSLNKTCVETGIIMGKSAHLTLGRCQLEWEQMNCGIFLYWHGRLIEAYKRVGGMIHNGDTGRGVIGVIDVSDLMDEGNGLVWVHNNKQGFLDCEPYARLEEWLGKVADEYWDNKFDSLNVVKDGALYKPDQEWVQCNKCRKWRMLDPGFDTKSLPVEWFCYMKPFEGLCDLPEQKVDAGVVTVSAKRTGYDSRENSLPFEGIATIKVEDMSSDSIGLSRMAEDSSPLKRIRRGLPRACKKV